MSRSVDGSEDCCDDMLKVLIITLPFFTNLMTSFYLEISEYRGFVPQTTDYCERVYSVSFSTKDFLLVGYSVRPFFNFTLGVGTINWFC